MSSSEDRKIFLKYSDKAPILDGDVFIEKDFLLTKSKLKNGNTIVPSSPITFKKLFIISLRSILKFFFKL